MESIKRRTFLKSVGVGAASLAASLRNPQNLFGLDKSETPSPKNTPIVISTWNHGIAANEAAYKILQGGSSALDAVEKGVNVSESDPNVRSVGYGGLPDKTGKVTLDACIMDHNGNAGAVAFLQDFMNPVSIARKVMEETKHIFLVGKGAEEFALKHGFQKHNLLTKSAEDAWKKWKQTESGSEEKDDAHDTIGMLALDSQGRLSGACTTSGLAFKIHGRVGDSPLIGSGLYVDNEVGGAAATGIGEECIKICGSFLIVELMRNGYSPQDACVEALKRVIKRHSEDIKFQLAFIALNKEGKVGAASLTPGFQFAVYEKGQNILHDSYHLIG